MRLFARVGLAAAMVAVVIALATGGQLAGPMASGVSLLTASAAAHWAVARGRIDLGGRALLLGVFAVLVGSAVFGGGAASGAPTMAVTGAAVAALLVGFPAARWYAALSIIALALITWLVANGTLPDPPVPFERRMIYVAAHVIAAAAIVLRPVHRLRGTLEAKRDAVAAAESTARALYTEEARLAREVTARTEDLLEANRGLSSFRYAVSHDLRAPLRAILGFSSAAREDHPAAMARGTTAADLDAIETDAKQIDRTITSVLAEVERHEPADEPERAPLPVPVPPFTADLDAARDEMVTRLTGILFAFPTIELVGALARPRPPMLLVLSAVELALVVALAVVARRRRAPWIRAWTAFVILAPALVAPFFDGMGLRSPYLVGAVGATCAIGFFMPRAWSVGVVVLTLADLWLLRWAHLRGWIPEQPLDAFAMVAGTAIDAAFVQFFLERPLALTLDAEQRTNDALSRRRALLDTLERATGELEQGVEAQKSALAQAHEQLDASARTLAESLDAPLARIVERSERIVAACHDAGDSAAADTVTRIAKAAARMREMIDALLTLSRSSGAGMQLREVPGAEIEQIVGEIVSELLPGAARDRVELTCGPFDATEADPALLRTVLANLLSNAFKYSRERERAHVVVQSERGELVVRDDGVGFDAQNGADLFGVFRRLHPKGRFEGHGIGLATVRRIVARHGGSIRATSALDQGTEVRFRLRREG